MKNSIKTTYLDRVARLLAPARWLLASGARTATRPHNPERPAGSVAPLY